jgi:hypothetical protein
MPKMTVFLDAPYFWQTGYKEPSLFSNAHLTFILIILVSFVVWFLVCAVYYYVIYRNRADRKFAELKELKTIWLWLVFFLIALPLFLLWEFEIPTTSLESTPMPQEPQVINPLWGPPSAAKREMLHQVSRLLKDMGSLGYSRDLVLEVLHSRTPDEFWELEYGQKRYCIQRYLEAVQKQDKQIPMTIAILVCVTTLIVVILWVYPRQ